MAKKIFYEDPYMKTFEAKVVSVSGNRVVLNQTCFFPEGGGQVGDTGTISGIRVVDTVKENTEMAIIDGSEVPVGGEVVHIMESEVGNSFSVGDVVSCEIDWNRRLKIMRLHGASHIMEHFLYQVFGELVRIGSTVDDRKDSSNYKSEKRLDNERLKKVEELCNEFISGGHPVVTCNDTENPKIRVWESGPIVIKCGGTHVKNSSEIGMIRLKRKNKGAGVERVETYLVDA